MTAPPDAGSAITHLFIHAWTTMQGWNWLAIIQAASAMWVATVATRALRTWKVQSQAERKAKLLDELLDGVHAYLDGLVKPITIAGFVKIGMDSYIPPGTTDTVAGAIDFITRAGAGEAARLFDALKAAQPSKERIESLTVKGQVLGFYNYERCQKAVLSVTGQINKLAAISSMIASSSLNWENPMVKAQLERIISIDIDQMTKELEAQHAEILAFAKEAYVKIYR